MYREDLVIDYFEKLRSEKIKYIERELKVDYLEGKAVSILGPRRAGKTYFLLNQFFNNLDNSIYIDSESIEFSRIEPEEILEIITLYETRFNTRVHILLLDEIQNIKDWNRLVRTLLDRKYKIFISGSSSKLLPKEISTILRGRTLSYILLPFSFKEFLKARGVKLKKPYSLREIQEIKILLQEYLGYGGFPEVVLSDLKEKILKEYFETIFYRDFVERHNVRSINTARVIFEYLLQNFSNEISIEKIKNYLYDNIRVTTKNTIYSYIDKITDTLSIFFIDRFSPSIFKRRRWPKKVYICDVGISNILSFSIDIGKRMENIVFLELIREINEKPFLSVFYWKDYQGKEVDFVVKDGMNVKQLIQVTYSSSRDEIKKREIRSLLKASRELECKDLLIITWGYDGTEIIENREVKYVPLWKWLLNPR